MNGEAVLIVGYFTDIDFFGDLPLPDFFRLLFALIVNLIGNDKEGFGAGFGIKLG